MPDGRSVSRTVDVRTCIAKDQLLTGDRADLVIFDRLQCLGVLHRGVMDPGHWSGVVKVTEVIA